MKRISICLVLASFAFDVHATTLMKESFTELVAKADGIAVATVRDVTSRRASDGMFYTFVRLEAHEMLKGSAEKRFTLRVIGGRVGDEVIDLVGAPRFAPGDKIVAFVRGNGALDVPLVGWTQGVYRVSRSSDGQEKISDHEGNRVIMIQGDQIVAERKRTPAARIVTSRDIEDSAPRLEGGVSSAGAGNQQSKPTDFQMDSLQSISLMEFELAIRAEARRSQSRGGGLTLKTAEDFTGIRFQKYAGAQSKQ